MPEQHTKTQSPRNENLKPHFERTPSGLTTINGRIDKVSSLKERWWQASPIASKIAGGTIAGSAALVGSNAHLLNPVVLVGALSALAMGGVAAYVLHLTHRGGCFPAYKHIFVSKEMGSSAIRSAEQTFELLDPVHGIAGLWDGLEQLEKLLKRRGQIPNRTPAGTSLDPDEVIFTDEPGTFRIIMRESLFAYVTRAAKDTATQTKLPERVQQYIAENYPDVVSAQPSIFSAAILNAYHPGFYEIVQTLLATGSTTDELRDYITSWIDQGQNPPSGPQSGIPQDFF